MAIDTIDRTAQNRKIQTTKKHSREPGTIVPRRHSLLEMSYRAVISRRRRVAQRRLSIARSQTPRTTLLVRRQLRCMGGDCLELKFFWRHTLDINLAVELRRKAKEREPSKISISLLTLRYGNDDIRHADVGERQAIQKWTPDIDALRQCFSGVMCEHMRGISG